MSDATRTAGGTCSDCGNPWEPDVLQFWGCRPVTFCSHCEAPISQGKPKRSTLYERIRRWFGNRYRR